MRTFLRDCFFVKTNFHWTASTPGSASGYSAVAYYFGRELRRQLGVPVGLIQQSMGATEIECWTPATGSEIVPSQAKFVRMVERVEADYQKLREESLNAWIERARDAIANEEDLPALRKLTQTYPELATQRCLYEAIQAIGAK